MVNISQLSKAEVLQALWNGSKMQGLSFLGMIPEMTIEKAEEEVLDNTRENGDIRIDYCCGKVIKCDITGTSFEPRLYDRDLGEGAAQNVITELYKSKGFHQDKMYSEGDIIDLISTDNYIDATDDRPIYRIIFEEGKGFSALGVKPDERKIDLGEFFTKIYTDINTSNDIKIVSSSPNFFDISIPGFTESGAYCIYNDLLAEIKNTDSRTIV